MYTQCKNSNPKTEVARIFNIDNNKKRVVNKTLFWFKIMPLMSLNQLKLIDIFLSDISMQHQEKTIFAIEKKDFEYLIGVDRIKNDKLDNLVESLNKICVVTGANGEDYHIFSILKVEFNEKTKERFIKMCINEKANWMFFSKDLRMITYPLKNTLSLKSTYSFIMYSYLCYNRFKRNWIENIETLKELLGCENIRMYEKYKFFNSRLLKKINDEITEKTSLKYKYSHKKLSTEIKFTII